MEQFGPSAFDKMDDIIYSEAAIIKLGVHIMDSLENLHQAGYAHNDIKQANITIGRPGDPLDGRARLIDYGVAEKLVTSDLDYYKLSLTSKETDFKGNILMTTTERLRGYPPTRRDDLVNLILMLIFMLDSLPYSNYYFKSNKSEFEKLKYLRSKKKAMKPKDYCSIGRTKFLLPILTEIWALKPSDVPNYDKFRFLLNYQLLEIGKIPSN